MAFNIIERPEPREFKYKPRYYKPEQEESTGDHRTDFANHMHDEWDSKRRHGKDKQNKSWLPIMCMLFFAIILALVIFKFFA